MRQGAQPTWRNKIEQWTKSLKGRRILPAFIGVTAVFWVSLLVFGMHLVGPADSAAPADKTKNPAAQNASVTLSAVSQPNTGNQTNASGTAGTPVTPVRTGDSGAAAAVTPSLAVSADTADTAIGGRGADAAAGATITTPEPTPSASVTPEAAASVGVSVGNPLASDGSTLLDVGASADPSGAQLTIDIL